jgi:hypothetical protein
MRSLYEILKPYTMVPEKTFEANLALVKQFRHIHGCVVECGVWRGGMIAGISTVLGNDRTYFLLDSFQGLPPAQPIDGPAAIAYQQDILADNYYDNCRTDSTYATSAMIIAGCRHFSVVPGWFKDTLPRLKFVSSIAVLRLDGDWYESTSVCLRYLYPKVAPGGLVIIDDYYAWDGCHKAVNDFFSPRDIRTDEDTNTCYIIKP